jgi:hypothetical protein
MFSADAATFLADDGVTVTWTSSPANPKPSGLMLFDRPDSDAESGEIISRDYLVTFETAAWAGLKRAEVLTINGVAYKLRADPHQLSDGVFSTAKLSKQ